MFVKSAFRAFVGKNFSNAYSLFRSLRLEANPLFHWNLKITNYFKKRDVGSARKLFDEMPHKNVVTWNCMISGYIRNGMIREARQVFDSMPIKNVFLDCDVEWVCKERIEEGQALFDAMPVKNDVSWAMMIEGYFRIWGKRER
ncbi:hypothetical protein Sango_1553700 [Sesamum angolense]|uniref:Pentatricopeptide repeat-containing protein n=1 Tax=Sesamum angolense TaxID=2727404 RepID=A0AAE1WPR5_9LAMI|nr:hypothetical protein Sango_1553700 [Sesamum angolense]